MFRYTTILISLAMVAGCSNTQQQAVDPGEPTFAREDMVVSTGWLKLNLDNPHVVVVHVSRDAGSYNSGHIPGARLLLWDDIAVSREGLPDELPSQTRLMQIISRMELKGSDRVVLYDDDTGLLAARAYVTFDHLGLGERTALLDGQLAKWKDDKLPLETKRPTTRPLMSEEQAYVPRPRPGNLVYLRDVQDIVWLRNNLTKARVSFVDARPVEEYTGEKPGTDVCRPGHIPGAINVEWRQNLLSETNPQFLPRADLRRLYTAAGVIMDDLVIVYCRTETHAAMDYFVLKYLGYDVRLYDAGYYEWNQTPSMTVAEGLEPGGQEEEEKGGHQPIGPSATQPTRPATQPVTQPASQPPHGPTALR